MIYQGNPFFSVVVPVYNSQKYLNRCIESILGQTFKEFECIIVDDGSTDDSHAIIDGFAKKDGRIKCIYKSNGGLSSARNAGLVIARGDWVIHLDSDDYLELEAFEQLKEIIDSNKFDILTFEYLLEYDSGKKEVHRISSNSVYGQISKETAVKQVLCDCPFICTRVCRRSLAQQVRFNEDIRRGADTVYLFDLIEKCDSFMVVNQPLYHYVQTQGSLARSKITESQLSVMDSSRLIYNFIMEKYPQFTSLVLDHYVNTRVNLYYKMYMSDYRDDIVVKEMLADVREKWSKLCKFNDVSLKKRLKYQLFDFSPRMYCGLLKMVVGLLPNDKYNMYKKI